METELFDVLEHIEEDCVSLSVLRDRVKKEGKLLLTVPAYQYLWSQHDVVHHHKRRYSVSHLRRLLKESGWMLNYISYFNTFLFSLDLIDRIKQKIMPSQKYNQLNVPSRWLNQLLQ